MLLIAMIANSNTMVSRLKYHLNPVVIETFARLQGALAFVETLNDGLPTLEKKERHYLEHLASDEGWGDDDFAIENQILHKKFNTWIPTLAAYGATILLHSIVETQLDAFADYIGRKRGSKCGGPRFLDRKIALS